MDISGLTSPQLTFSYTQPSWAGDQDELRVWYKAAAGDDWSELAAYTSSVTAWETVTLDLPNASSDYYVAFNGTAGYGYGITLDDVCVDAAPTEPLMSVTATTGNGSATAFTLSNSASTNDVFVFYNGVAMKPTTDYAISGATLTFTFAPINNSQIMARYFV